MSLSFLQPVSIMDATLRHCPSRSKRPCSSSSDPSLIPNPSSVDDHIDIDSLLDSFLALSTTPSLDLSFDRLLHSRPSDSDQTDMINRALTLGSLLLEAAKRSARKQASIQNSLLWPLPPDLTIKVRTFIHFFFNPFFLLFIIFQF